MRTTFQQRLDGLEAKLGQMGQVLRSQLDRTLTALATADADVADEVIRRDRLLDADYVEVEEEILRTLALECFTNRDIELAERLPIMDQPLDELNERVFRQLENLPAERGTTTPGPWASRMVLAARYLERIGDHSVDIGEQVVFIVTGEVRELVPPKAVRAQLER